MAPTGWPQELQGWKIEVVTERVDGGWICRQIRVTFHPKTARPTLLSLDGSFPSLSQALHAGEEHARRWIDQAVR